MVNRPTKIYSEAAKARYMAYGDKYAKRAIMSNGTIRSYFAGVPVESVTGKGAGRIIDRRMQGAGYTIIWKDAITPASMMWEVGMDLAVGLSAGNLQKAIPRSIAKIYDMGGRPKWTPSKKMGTIASMNRRGKTSVLATRGERTMSRSGNLARVVHLLPAHIRVVTLPTSLNGKSATRTIMMTGLDEGFAEAPYVWYHEMGTKKTPRRPFVFQGIQEGWNRTIASMNYALNAQHHLAAKKARQQPTTRVLTSPTKFVPIAAEMKTYEPTERLSAFALMWWLLPPSQAWAVLGGGSDVMALISGDMLQARYLLPWLQAFAMGKMGTMAGMPMTKKTARRGFRRKLYRGKGKYRKN